MTPTRNNRGVAHENGAIEGPHAHLKSALAAGPAAARQQRLCRSRRLSPLRRRGGRPRQCRRRKALEIERASSSRCRRAAPTDHEEDLVTVTRSGGFLLRRVFYTVPSRLIGHRLRVRLYDDRLECLLGSTLVLTLPRGRSPKGRADRGRRGHVVDYRHVIHALRRKPMALLNLVYRDQLFPRDAFRHAWDALLAAQPPRNACRTMVGLLALAHDRVCEAELATALDAILDAGEAAGPGNPATSGSRQPAWPSRMSPSRLPAAIAYDALLSTPQVGLRS